MFLIQEGLVERGQTVVYNRWPEAMALPEALERLHGADSLMIFSAEAEQLPEIKAVLKSGTSIMCVGDTFFDAEIPTVHTTNEGDTARAVRILRERGCQNIVGLLPHPRLYREGRYNFTCQRRLLGLRRALAENGAPKTQLAPKKALIYGSPEDQARQLLELETPPDGLIWIDGVNGFPDLFALLKDTPLQLGRNLQLAAWDENLWNCIAPLGLPFLSIEQPLQHIADIAVGELLRMVDNPTYRAPLGKVTSQMVWVNQSGAREILN